MWTVFKVFIEFVTILLLFYVLFFWPRGMWDLISPTRDRTCTLCIGRQSLNRWTAREIPERFLLKPCLMVHALEHSTSYLLIHYYDHSQSLLHIRITWERAV